MRLIRRFENTNLFIHFLNLRFIIIYITHKISALPAITWITLKIVISNIFTGV